MLAPDSDFFPTIASFLANTITVPDVESPQRLTYQPYEDILSAALYHETTHMAGLGLNDVKTPDGETAYGWTKIMQLGTKQRLMNADNYLFLGLLARYEKLGVCLHPDAAEAKAGTLVRAPAGWAAP